MLKVLKVPGNGKMHEVTIRNYGRGDFAKLIALQKECFPPPFPSELWWNAEQLTEHTSRFPEGALCAVIEETIVGSMTALRRTIRDSEPQDWASVTDTGYIRNHEPDGDTLYVVDLCVDPRYRKLGLGKWLMQSMYETVVYLGCKRLLGGGRMPGYRSVSDRYSPEQYIEQAVLGRLRDPVISFMLDCGRLPAGIVTHYLEDEPSAHYGALMEWKNPFIEERE